MKVRTQLFAKVRPLTKSIHRVTENRTRVLAMILFVLSGSVSMVAPSLLIVAFFNACTLISILAFGYCAAFMLVGNPRKRRLAPAQLIRGAVRSR